jgi:hypothetical protein
VAKIVVEKSRLHSLARFPVLRLRPFGITYKQEWQVRRGVHERCWSY